MAWKFKFIEKPYIQQIIFLNKNGLLPQYSLTYTVSMISSSCPFFARLLSALLISLYSLSCFFKFSIPPLERRDLRGMFLPWLWYARSDHKQLKFLVIRSTFGFSGSYLLRFVTFYFEIFEKIFLRFLGNLLGNFFFRNFCV